MIQANVVKGIQEVLTDAPVDPRQQETIAQHVARALHISEHQAEIFLEALDRGATLDDATAEAQIDPATVDQDLLTRIARAVGAALGEIRQQLPR